MLSAPSRTMNYSTAVMAGLVLLRFAIGWHFFSEGAKKLKDPDFRSAYFLNIAVGPLSGYFQSLIPDAFGVERLNADDQLASLARLHQEVVQQVGDDCAETRACRANLEGPAAVTGIFLRIARSGNRSAHLGGATIRTSDTGS